MNPYFVAAAATAFVVGLVHSVLVFVGTLGKHPGWIGLLVVALCTWLGRSIWV